MQEIEIPSENLEQRSETAVRVKIKRADGKVAFVFLTVGLNRKGQPTGEVSVKATGRREIRKKATGSWLEYNERERRIVDCHGDGE